LEIFNNGAAGLVDGTSAATPIFASIVSLLNDELIAAGKSTLGFINPLLYANAGALNDITRGDNPGCNTNGFSASSGWDPVTGLGTPNYPALKSLVGCKHRSVAIPIRVITHLYSFKYTG
jgi:tripeptidyl-peptidase-1